MRMGSWLLGRRGFRYSSWFDGRGPHPSPLPGGEGAIPSAEERVKQRGGRAEDVRVLERNDVALAGLNHKLGYRGIPNTLLNFGEGKYPVRAASGGGLDGRGAGAIGYLVGRPGEGLRCMFHMMNEARIAVGLGAATLGYAG